MFCSHCGAEIEEDAKVCSQCGHPVDGKGQAKKSAAASRIRKINIEDTDNLLEGRQPSPGGHTVSDMTEQLPDLSAMELEEASSGSNVRQNTLNLNEVVRAARSADAVSTDTVRLTGVSQDTVKLDAVSTEAIRQGAAGDMADTVAVSQDTVKLDAVNAAASKMDAVSQDTVQLDAASAEAIRQGMMAKAAGTDEASQDTVILNALDFDTVSLDGLDLNSMDLDDDDLELVQKESVADDDRLTAKTTFSSDEMPHRSVTSQRDDGGSNIRGGKNSGSGNNSGNSKSGGSGGNSRSGNSRKGKNSGSGVWAAVGALLVLAVIVGAVVFMFRNKVSGPNYSDMILSGNEFYSEGSYDKAAELFNKAVEAFPEKAEGYLGLANVYIARNDSAKAAEILEEGYEKTHSAELKQKLDEVQGNVSETNKQTEPPGQAQSETPEQTEPPVQSEPPTQTDGTP